MTIVSSSNYIAFQIMFFILAITVDFNKSTYNIYEDSKVVLPTLIFSNPSSTDMTVQVHTMNITAVGKLCWQFSVRYDLNGHSFITKQPS